MNKITVSFALARFVFISCFAMASIITTLVVNHVVDSVNKEYEKIATREINGLSNNYKVFINHHLILLSDQSNTPLFIQTLMQPDANVGKIKDLMEDLTLLGHKYGETLLDFEGNTLHSTTSLSVSFKQLPWVKDILTGKKQSAVKVMKTADEYYWYLAVPIIYNEQVEGVLIANIPLNAINVRQSNDEKLDGLMIDVVKNHVTITTFGKRVVGTKHIIDWPDEGVSFHFTVDETNRDEALSNLVLQLASLIVVAMVIVTLLAYIYGYRYFVKPIVALSQSTSNLEKGDVPTTLTEDLIFKELSDLFKQFNHMSQKVTKREQALKLSYSKLSDANEELIQSESQLVQSEKMASIGVLAAGVAHEINNPIGFIRSNLVVLEEYFEDINNFYQEFKGQLSTETERNIHEMLAKKHELEFIFDDAPPLLKSSIGGVDRVTEIVTNLKTFARVDQPDKMLVDINEGLNATLNMVSNELKYSCRMHVDLKALPRVFAFPGKLNQVFMNLLINAGQAITDKGDIYVSSFVEEKNIVIKIEDTGKGIEENDLGQIFTPFYTSKPIGEGTGLGLSISHQIIEQHQGEIKVTSTVGKGSCFAVYIPINDTDS